MDSAKTLRDTRENSFIKSILYYKYFYMMLIPVIIWYAIFAYAPMYGVTLAFKSFNYNKGIFGSPWIGVANFVDIMSDVGFWSAFKNTIIISMGKLIFNFPTPIILAVMLNEIVSVRIKRIYQTIFTFPHFISWVVLSGILLNILGQNGVINQIIGALGVEPVAFLSNETTFRPILYITAVWKEIGWDSVIYMAAIAGISAELHEAAEIDGANRWQRIVNVTWPGIRPTVAILLILTIGQSLSLGSSFDQIFNLYSSPVYGVADTIDTFIYRTTFTTGADFGYMTAIGLLKSIINLFLIYSANLVVKKIGEQGLF